MAESTLHSKFGSRTWGIVTPDGRATAVAWDRGRLSVARGFLPIGGGQKKSALCSVDSSGRAWVLSEDGFYDVARANYARFSLFDEARRILSEFLIVPAKDGAKGRYRLLYCRNRRTTEGRGTAAGAVHGRDQRQPETEVGVAPLKCLNRAVSCPVGWLCFQTAVRLRRASWKYRSTARSVGTASSRH
jgi:hypothetical protein